jgi:hypothetical protein
MLALVGALLLVLATPVFAMKSGHDPDDPFRRVRIPWEAVAERPEALRGTELMGIERGSWVDVLARNDEIERFRSAGISFEVIVPDLEAQAARRFSADNFGIFHTYSETVDFLNALHATYPAITTDKISLGTTWEGRTIWAMKISDNPDVQESGEPEVLFDALHHAREIMTVEVLIDYMSWLCQNYGVDPEATQIVDNRQIWFVPIVNPDGFVYNETTNPMGGGMWRKNRRDDLGSCVGVDLNRNYPYEWGSAGSTDPCDESFRGPSAASELEVQAMIDFIEAHEFKTHNSYHSVVGAILFPWVHTSSLTPDDATFRSIAAEMSSENGYVYGTAPEILDLVSGGIMFDWTYGEQSTKPKIFSFTTEVDGSGFWPPESQRDGLVLENHYSNIVLTKAAGVPEPSQHLLAAAALATLAYLRRRSQSRVRREAT